jgi:PPOX class F420-dependent enzyme/OxyR family protein
MTRYQLEALMPLDEIYVTYLNGQNRGRLATVTAGGSPQNKPVGYRYNADLGTIDIVGFDMERSAKYRNIGVNPAVSFVVDDAVGEGASNMRMLEIRGDAEQVAAGGSHLIRIHPRRLVGWNIDPQHPGLHTADVAGPGASPAAEPDRPALGLGGRVASEATDAAARLVGELQAGWDTRDADVTNRHFAADLLWGSPFGATVHGYEPLHAIHLRLKQQGRGGPASRFELVKVLAPAPGVALAQIRRVALGPDGEPVEPSSDLTGPFSEMVLYVLVRRGGTWWVAAGQNTPIQPPPS